MAFKLKGKSIVQGTSSHKAALKQQDDRRKLEHQKRMREEREKKRELAPKKPDKYNDLNVYLKKMEELLDKGLSPKEAEQMLADKPLKQVEEKEKGSSSDMDAEAAREDAKMIEIAKKRGYTMKLVDGKIVKVPVDKKTGKPIKDAAPKQKKQDDFEPAYPGADYSQEQIDKMTEKEKLEKIDGYQPKKKKGKIVYKDGKKFYKASDGTLHTGQVEDYERELEIDKANKPLKMKSPAKQKNKPITQGGKFLVEPEIKKSEHGKRKILFPKTTKTGALKQKVEVFGGRATIDVSTEAGKKLLKEIKSIPTVSSSDPARVTKSASSKVKSILSKHAGKLLDLGVKSSVILSMFDPMSAGKGSTTLDKDEYNLMNKKQK